MTKTLVGYYLNVKGEKRLVVGTKRINVDENRFKMKEGCFLKIKDWDGEGKLEDWAREQYVKKYSEGEVLEEGVYFHKNTIQSPDPHNI